MSAQSSHTSFPRNPGPKGTILTGQSLLQGPKRQPQTITGISLLSGVGFNHLLIPFLSRCTKDPYPAFSSLPSSAEHSSLHMMFFQLSLVQSFRALHQASFSVSAGRFFARQFVIPLAFRIFLIVYAKFRDL